MTIEHIAPDLDRLQLSAELWGLATRYMLEATMAETPEDAQALGATARQLNERARAVLTVGDIETADAYARSASLHIGLIEGARRLMWAMVQVPAVRIPSRCLGRYSRHWYAGMPACQRCGHIDTTPIKHAREAERKRSRRNDAR